MRDQETLHENDRPSILDRAWAETRPAELSSDEFDRIWAETRRAYDERPAVVALPSNAPRRRRALAFAVLGLAQAAAVLAVAFVLIPRRDDRPAAAPEVALKASTPRLDDLKIDFDEMVVIELVGEKVDYLRSKPDANAALAYLDVPANNPNDQLSSWETLAND